MRPYANVSGNSGVVGYELKQQSVVLEFQDGWKYEYTVQSAGAAAIAAMKRLAVAGEGLSAFVSQQVRHRYARKFR